MLNVHCGKHTFKCFTTPRTEQTTLSNKRAGQTKAGHWLSMRFCPNYHVPEVLERLRLTRAPLHASDLKVCREDASVFFRTMPGDMCPKGMEHGKSVRNSAAFLAGSL